MYIRVDWAMISPNVELLNIIDIYFRWSGDSLLFGAGTQAEKSSFISTHTFQGPLGVLLLSKQEGRSNMEGCVALLEMEHITLTYIPLARGE